MVFTPKKIVEELDKYIISQEEAKKSVAISLRNRYRRKLVENKELSKEITPKNIILVGPTGVGKTEIARRLAKVSNSPFLKVEATKFTEVGYVGKDVESMIKDLVNITFRMVKGEKFDSLKEKVSPLVKEKLIKKLRPFEVNDGEKKLLLEALEKGEFDDEEVEVDKAPLKSEGPVIEVFGGPINEGEGIQDVLDNLMKDLGGKKTKTVKMKVKEAISYMIKEEIDNNLDLDELGPEVIKRVEDNGIIFIDEIDKIADREGFGRGEVSRQGVQRDILPIVEGTTVMTKYGPCKTDHILFIAAGAFTMSSPSDLMPELQGRFPVRVKLKSLTKEDFVKILTQVENNLLEQYIEMLKVDKVILSFTKTGIERIAEVAMEINDSIENIGARRLHTVLERLLEDIMYEAPYDEEKTIKISKKEVDKVYTSAQKSENLNDYIL
ncbi:MAG: ATP-dependent protease ATPase subunit HslU [Fusobacteriaceae bacterium]|nr:ATP-dependent protease ATPase subunit HslU [Fusobacteriaceae bacterium]MBP6468085.1 ATP-dependent protease ATPase subunit HslU [Fusobacteriaceae bacterium]MBP9596609.1 ATP-dependent protease ATPase subunit HslU [Fusobacteriaceae bacterium]MBU9918729.1 ATP-dependent protease ATPase subunit HslU [Fusobacteriaceae bacterium]